MAILTHDIEEPDPFMHLPDWLPRYLRRKQKGLARWAQSTLELIDGGKFGAAYGTLDGRVIKITMDETEVANVAHLLESPLRKYPGVAKPWKIGKLAGGKVPLWVISMERVLPYIPEGDKAQDCMQALHDARTAAVALSVLNGAKGVPADFRAEVMRYPAAHYLREWEEALQEASNYHPAFELIAFVLGFQEEFGVCLADVRFGNIGVRESGDLCCYDLGFTAGLEIPAHIEVV